jgi:peptidoglycan hydrolase-like protein with peptidoglycan-binding domain
MKKTLSLFLAALFILPLFVGAQTSSTAACTLTLPLALGGRGTEVICLQGKLITLGLLTDDSATGYFGQLTRQAVKTFQTNNNLEAVGSIGPLTRLALNSLNVPQTPPPAVVSPTVPSTPTTPQTPNQPVAPSTPSTATLEQRSNTYPTPDWLKDDGYVPTLNPKGAPLPTPVSTALSVTQTADAQKYAQQFNIPQSSLTTPITSCIASLRADFNDDKKVDVFDLILLGNNYNKPVPAAYPKLDVNGDAKAGFDELVALAQDFGKALCVVSQSNFKIIDSVAGYPGKLTPFIANGIPAMTAGPSSFIANGDFTHPDEATTRAFARSLPYGYYVIIDIEEAHWNTDIRNTTQAVAQKAAQNFQDAMDWVHSERPDIKIGVYEMVPVSEYYKAAQYGLGVDALNRLTAGEQYTDFLAWARGGVASPVGAWTTNGPWRIDPTREWTADYLKWQAANDFLRTLASHADFVVPQLYSPETGQPGFDGWKLMAIENIKEALRYGKPVYPILMKSYFYPPHADIEPEIFRQQLDVIKAAGAQGVIMFDYGGGTPWQQFPWFTQIQNFARDNGLIPTGAAVSTATDDFGQTFWLVFYIIGLALAVLYLIVRMLQHLRKNK